MTDRLISEVTAFHGTLCQLLVDENERYTSLSKQCDLSASMTQLDKYLRKLRSLQKEMSTLTEQSHNLRKRAEQLQMLRQKEDEKFADEMERIKLVEQSLKPVKPTSSKT